MPRVEMIESLFLEVCGEQLAEENGFSVRGELGVFSTAMVTWLGIQSRLGNQSLNDALGQMVERLEVDPLSRFIQRPGRKLREKDVSLNSGGLSRARSRMSESLTRKLFQQAATKIEQTVTSKIKSAPIYIVDGVVITTARSAETLKRFGSVKHKKKVLHYPKIRVVGAHGLDSGICKALVIGSYTDHEIALATKLLEQIPRGAILLMDRGFASPALVEKANSLGIKVVVRMKDDVAKKLLKASSDGALVSWVGSRKTEKGFPVVEGRITSFAIEVPGFRSSAVQLFTNTDLDAEYLPELYRKRVQIETAIRHLKQTLDLFFISSKTPEAIEKDVYIAYLTFNLIRGIMIQVAAAEDISVTRLSFTATVNLVRAYSKSFLLANKKEHPELYRRFRKHLCQAKLALRKKPRSYPRAVKLPREKYPAIPYEAQNSDRER